MDPKFWHQRWKENRIGFHMQTENPMLVRFLSKLNLKPGDRLFLPLCGKTLDIGWLLSQGFRVAGAELSELAIQQLFSELGLSPEISNLESLKLYKAENLDIFVGDIFDLKSDVLGSVDAVYDRAALVALPEEMRSKYTSHLTKITKNAPQLLITFNYDQNQMAGPPFAVSGEEVKSHYQDKYELNPLVSINMVNGIKNGIPATESVWLLKNKS